MRSSGEARATRTGKRIGAMWMDKEICLEFIDGELNSLYRERNELRKAQHEGDFKKMARIMGKIEYGSIQRLHNLIGRDLYEDWGSVAMREAAKEEQKA